MNSSTAWRRGLVGFVLFGGIGLMFVFGGHVLGLDGAAAAHRWLAEARGPWALPAAVGAFAVLAFLGVPQFVLIAAALAAFGPWRGMAYSWAGTMVSALVGFCIGRVFGAPALRDFGGDRLDQFVGLIGRNAILASLAVRLVPFAPFILVNVAAGVTAMRTADFTAGTAIGIIPKIVLTAFAGAAIVRVMNGGGLVSIIFVVCATGLWLVAGLAARRWLRRLPIPPPADLSRDRPRDT